MDARSVCASAPDARTLRFRSGFTASSTTKGRSHGAAAVLVHAAAVCCGGSGGGGSFRT